MPRIKELLVNGQALAVDVDDERTLLTVLRDDLDLTGSKYGCGEGECGACTVLIDGVAARSCQRKVRSLAGKKITTIEGLSPHGTLNALQQAFLDAGALQCGYCTAGMIVAAQSLLNKNPRPTESEIVRALDGNLCRCGTYTRILTAVTEAARRLGGAK